MYVQQTCLILDSIYQLSETVLHSTNAATREITYTHVVKCMRSVFVWPHQKCAKFVTKSKLREKLTQFQTKCIIDGMKRVRKLLVMLFPNGKTVRKIVSLVWFVATNCFENIGEKHSSSRRPKRKPYLQNYVLMM